MKKIIFIILMLILINVVNASIENFAKDGAKQAICKSEKGSAACQAYSALNDPTGKLMNELGPQAMQFFSGIQDPLGTGKGIIMDRIISSLPPETQSAIQFYNQFQKYLGKINNFFGKDEANRYEADYEDGNAVVKKDGKDYIKVPPSWGIVEEDTPAGAIAGLAIEDKKPPRQPIECKESICQDLEIFGVKFNNIPQGTKIIFSDNPKTFEIKGYGDLNIKGKPMFGVQDGKFIFDEDDNVKFANFVSKNGGQYPFNYNKVDYNFNVGKGGEVLFDPSQLKLGGKNLKQFKIGNKILEGDFTINFGDKGLETIKNIEFGKNGEYIDKDNNLLATSPEEFIVCLSTQNAAKTNLDKIKGCEANNYFWLNKEDSLNLIKTNGKIKYAIGKYTAIDSTEKGAKTNYYIFPDRDDKFQVTEGGAIFEKDEIRSWVEYKGKCPKITGGVVAFAVKILDIKQGVKGKPCGFFVETFRTGIPSVVTQRVQFIDPDGIYSVTINSEGTMSTFNKNTGESVNGAYRNFENPADDVLFSMYRATEAPIVDKYTMTRNYLLKYRKFLDEQAKNIQGGVINKNLVALFGIGGVQFRAEDAKQALEMMKSDIDTALAQLEQGYPIEDSIYYVIDLKTGKKGKGLTIPNVLQKSLNEGLNLDGSIKSDVLIDISKEGKDCLHINEYLMRECVITARLVNEIAKDEISRRNNLLEKDNKQTLYSQLINYKPGIGLEQPFDIKMRIDENVPIQKVAEKLENEAKFMKETYKLDPDAKKIMISKNPKIVVSANDLLREAERLRETYKNDPEIKKLEESYANLYSITSKLKMATPVATEFASVLDFMDVATIPILATKAATKSPNVARYLKLLKEYSQQNKALGNLINTADDGTDFFKVMVGGDKALVKELDDIPNIARVCL